MEVEFIRELDDYGAGHGGSACLVRRGDEHFVISSIPHAPDHDGPETLAFPCDENAEVTDWTDMAGGRGWSREQTIAELAEKGPVKLAGGRGMCDDPENPTLGDIMGSYFSIVANSIRGGRL